MKETSRKTSRKPVRKPRTKPGELPQILYNARGVAYINYRGQRHYLGKIGLLEAERERLRIVTEIKVGGNHSANSPAVTVAVLVRDFLKWAKKRYLKNGRSTGSWERFGYATAPLLALYANCPVSEFRPLALKAVRQKMVDSGLCRKTVNQRIGFVKQIFKWGVGEEMVPAEIKLALYDISGLKSFETTAVDYAPVEPVSWEVVEKTLKFCSPIIADMVLVQFYGSAMRPQDVCNMRACDIDRGGEIWVYTPWEHKTEHKNRKAERWLGPKAQEILLPYLTAKAATPEAFLFSPKDTLRYIKTEKRLNRKTKVQPSQAERAKLAKENPKCKAGDKYTVNAYRTAIQRAAKAADAAIWSPNQLRHARLTMIRKDYGLEAAQVIGGHASADVTQIYAERDREKAIKVMREIG